MTPRKLLAALVAAVTLVALAAFAYEQHERALAIEQVALAERSLAQALASTLSERLASDGALVPAELATTVKTLESCDGCIVVVRPPGAARLVGNDGQEKRSDALVRAIDQGLPTVVLGRSEARMLGVGRGRAVAGLATATGPDGSRWGLAVVGSASRAHDPDAHGPGRAMLGALFVSAIIAVFGGIALWQSQSRTRIGEELARLLGRKRRVDAVAADMVRQVQKFAAAMVENVRHSDAPPPSMRLVAASSVLGEVRTACTGALSGAGVSLEVAGEACEAQLVCDRRLIVQALSDLVAAAIEATARGGRVSLELVQGAGQVTFEVASAGPFSERDGEADLTDPVARLRLVLAEPVARLHRGALDVRAAGAGGLHASLRLPALRAEGTY